MASNTMGAAANVKASCAFTPNSRLFRRPAKASAL
jgi:hypothetical protein